MTKQMNKLRTCFSGTKLASKFKVKDKPAKKHQHNVVYEVTCPTKYSTAKYVGETSRRLSVRAKEHAWKDKRPKTGHKPVTINEFSILSRNAAHYYNRKIRESLYIKSINKICSIEAFTDINYQAVIVSLQIS